MLSKEGFENYLIEFGMPYEELGEGIYRLNNESEGVESIIISFQPPVAIFRVKLMEVPAKGREALYEKLLMLNASDMIGGAFALEKDAHGLSITVTETLQAENLDYNEFVAAIDSLTMAVIEHYATLKV